MKIRILLKQTFSVARAFYFALRDPIGLFDESMRNDYGTLACPKIEYPVADFTVPRSQFADSIL